MRRKRLKSSGPGLSVPWWSTGHRKGPRNVAHIRVQGIHGIEGVVVVLDDCGLDDVGSRRFAGGGTEKGLHFGRRADVLLQSLATLHTIFRTSFCLLPPASINLMKSFALKGNRIDVLG